MDRLCIICNTRKPESQFEKKGEHVVPRFLGNRRFRTPFVCTDCNNGLGGTVDVALKNVFSVMLACYDRGVSGRPPAAAVAKSAVSESMPPENLDVRGAILKIAYEAAHLRLGNNWLDDPIAVALRNVLFAYVGKNKKAAHEFIGSLEVHGISIALFYYDMNRTRSEFVKQAIISKSCLNALWLAPVKIRPGKRPLAIVFDIEGLPPGYVVVSDSDWGTGAPELLAPKLKISPI